ncbi:retrotransposon protein, putative, ty1-copia subclass [Tanacetum coccineum]
MLQEIKSMFEKQARVEMFDLIQTFHACKLKDGKPVGAHVLKMKDYVEQLECLGYVLPQDLSVGLILNGLTSDFAGFARNYNMHKMGKTIGELHALLIEYEKGLPKKAATPQVMAIQCGRIQKANKKSQKAKGKGKGKGKGKDKSYIPKPKNPKPYVKEHMIKNDAYHHYKEVTHWKRNCPVYLAELMKNKKQVGTTSSLGIFTIKLFSFPNKSWVYDTGCGTHICITKLGLRGARNLEQGALYLYVGNGVRTQVEAIGSFDLVSPNGLVIYYGILISKNDVLYFNAIPSNGIYEIDMSNLVPNVNSIYNVSNKRVKHNLDSTYLWHCRLAHITKKRIEKLQHDNESFDQCMSCLSDKMTRKSFPPRPKRATDLLGLIHSDVCGPLRHISRQCASYFITFTDDYSRYGYIYLLKHKHEVFETFKQLTPPYTSQHNGVSERRNRTLLDMVRSMMNLTTLSLSFWDYALESIARILNMVPTMKVDKTPYELWYAKVPNLSYLKETMGYYFYFSPENRIVVASYIEFFKKNILSQEVSGRAKDLKEIQDKDTSPSKNTSEIPMEVEGFKPPHKEEAHIWDLNEPANYKVAMLDPESNKLFDAVGSKWLFKKNTNMVGNVHTYKAHLVEKGFTQLYGVDYEETFLPVADIKAIRILIAIAAFYDYEIWQIDVKTAFLDGYLDEDIYRRMDNTKHSYIPMQERLDLNKTQGASTPREVKLMQNVPYALAVGSIINPKAELRVDCYYDARFEIDRDDTKSQIGYIFVLNGGAVDWKSSQQSTTAMSAIKAEYIAAMEAV